MSKASEASKGPPSSSSSLPGVTPTSCSPSHCEVLLTSEDSGHLWNCCLWDPSSGATLGAYKGHTSKEGTLTLLGDSLLVSARPGKPVLNLWSLHRHEQQPRVATTPGTGFKRKKWNTPFVARPLSALAADPSGKFLVGASKDKIYVWQTCSGRLLRVLGGHFQEVTTLRFTDDGSHFVSAGRDGNVLAWSLVEAVTRRRLPGQAPERLAKPEPKHTWEGWTDEGSDHRLEVTGLHVTAGGARARVFTVSRDHSSKVYCLASGRMLLDVSFAAPLTAVAVDAAEVNVFLGSEKGAIYTYSLLSPPRDFQMNVEPSAENTFSGHGKAVTCLSVSADGLTLASGSDDMGVKLWSVRARQFLRTLEHKGRVTEARFMAPLPGMLRADEFRPGLVLANLEKTLAEEEGHVGLELIVRHRQEPVEALREVAGGGDERPRKRKQGPGDEEEEEDEEGSEVVKRLKAANQELYQFAVKKVLATK